MFRKLDNQPFGGRRGVGFSLPRLWAGLCLVFLCLGFLAEEGRAWNEDVLIVDVRFGTPIVDIKPYIPRADCVPESSVPEWMHHGPLT